MGGAPVLLTEYGRLVYEGDIAIEGVPGTASAISLKFMNMLVLRPLPDQNCTSERRFRSCPIA